MAVKKKKRVKKSGFLVAARIADELGKEKKKPAAAAKVSSAKASLAKASSTKAAPAAKAASVKQKKVPQAVIPASKTFGHHRTLSEIAKESNSSEELAGFDDFDEEEQKVNNPIKNLNGTPSGVIEMLGGATMILILVEIVVLIVIIASMFFLK